MLTPAFWRRVVACLCLFGYLATGSGFGPVLAAVVAQRDAQHVVCVSSGEGKVRILLHHDGTRRDRIAKHEHQLPARLLTLLSATPGSAQSDHLMTFSAPEKARSENAASAPKTPSAFPAPMEWPPAEITLPSLAKSSTSFTRPPPVIVTASHTVVRSTVFLI